MNAFVNAIPVTHVQSRVPTENGGVTFNTSKSALLDIFSNGAAARGRDLSSIFIAALTEDLQKAVRLLFWLRDVRGGAGERDTFIKLFNVLAQYHPDVAVSLVVHVPEYGRFDDLLKVRGLGVREAALSLYTAILMNPQPNSNVGLAGKWAPRKGDDANALRNAMGLTPRQYRKHIVALSNTVEQKMCAKDWSNIVFEHVPSVAMARYRKAFGKRDGVRFTEYLNLVKSGEKKINASAVFPHDVIRDFNVYSTYHYDNETSAAARDAQWNALPNFLGDSGGILPVSDVSGSMGTMVSGSISALHVSIALGVYCAERQTGPFKNVWANFSSTPMLMTLKGDTVTQKIRAMDRTTWGMSTNIDALFDLVLDHGKSNAVSDADMPKTILILSDMEFDRCAVGSDKTAYEKARLKYAASNYTLPKIVFWNLASRQKNLPVSFDQNGTAMISGYSPAIMKSVLSSKVENFTPYNIMLDAIMSPRYDRLVA